MCYVFISRRTVCVLLICKRWFSVNEVEAWLAQMRIIFSCVCARVCVFVFGGCKGAIIDEFMKLVCSFNFLKLSFKQCQN